MSDPISSEEAVTRVCPKCSAQSTVPGNFCPNCGASYTKKGFTRPSRRSLIAIAIVAVLVASSAVGLGLKKSHDDRVRQDQAIAEASAEKTAEQQAAEEQESADEAERKLRKSYVRGLEKYIKKDARKNVKEGILDGPILSASCTATGGGSTDDLTALTGTFDCMAVNKKNSDDTISGYSYAGTIDWDSGELTWQLGR